MIELREFCVKVDVLFVGELILDIWLFVVPRGKSAEDIHAPNFTILPDRTLHLPGGMGTCARVAIALGAKARVVSATGRNGRLHHNQTFLHHAMEDAGIDDRWVDFRAELEVNVKTRPVYATLDPKEYQKQAFVLDQYTLPEDITAEHLAKGNIPARPISDAIAQALLANIGEAITTVQAVVVSEYNRGMLTERFAQGIAEEAREHGVPLMVDPKGHSVQWFKQNMPGIYLLTPNKEGMEVLIGRKLRTKADFLAAAREVRSELRCNVLLKLEEQGAVLFVANKMGPNPDGEGDVEVEGDEIPYTAYNGQPISVSGAGDTLIAVIAVACARGLSLPDACEMGCRAAAITVGKRGSEVVTAAELEAALEGVVLPSLVEIVRQEERLASENDQEGGERGEKGPAGRGE